MSLFARPTSSETTLEDAGDRRGGRRARFRDVSTGDARAFYRRARVVVVSAPRALTSPRSPGKKTSAR